MNHIHLGTKVLGKIKFYRGSGLNDSLYVTATSDITEDHTASLFMFSQQSSFPSGKYNIVEYTEYNSNIISVELYIQKESDVFVFRGGAGTEDCFLTSNMSEEELFQYSTVLPKNVIEFYELASDIHNVLPPKSVFSTNLNSLDYMGIELHEFI